MAKFRDPITGRVTEVGDPTLNPSLVDGKQRVVEPIGTITSSSLETQPEIRLPDLFEPSVPSVADLPSVTDEFRASLQPVQELTQEKTGLESRINELIGETGQIGARTQTLEEEAGIAEKRTQVTDLENQLRAIQAEAKQIPLQLQEEAKGRGITAGGLRPLQTARLRQNAIRALGVSAGLQAAQGSLATALDLVDRQIELEFAQPEAELAQRREQLALIRDDLSVAEGRRAEALERGFEREEREIEEQKEERKSIMDIYVNAAQAGANSVVLRQIQSAPNQQEALRIAGEAGVFKQEEEIQTQIIEAQGRRLLVNTQTGQVITDFGIADVGRGVGGELTVADGELSDKDLRTLQQADTAITSIDDVMSELGGITTGTAIGRTVLSFVPGTKARDLDAKLDTVKALVGFDALQKMRDASPTGGALGQVSERELGFLQSVAGSLELSQSTEQLKSNLTKIRQSFETLIFMTEARAEGHSDVEIQEFLRQKGKL